MAYALVRNKDVTQISDILREVNILQEDDVTMEINRDEAGIPIIACLRSKEAITEGCIVLNNKTYVVYKRLDCLPEITKSAYDSMGKSVELILKDKKLWMEELEIDIPRSCAKYGDMAVFDSRSFVDPAWARGGPEIWAAVYESLGVSRLARRCKREPDDALPLRAHVLDESNTWVTTEESGLSFSWYITSYLFDHGAAWERYRISEMNCQGETIVDLFAGIGQYTVYFLAHAKAEVVHACDPNEELLRALRCNGFQNAVLRKCLIYHGDNLQGDLSNET